jgi:putative FmdB family regulatory protein
MDYGANAGPRCFRTTASIRSPSVALLRRTLAAMILESNLLAEEGAMPHYEYLCSSCGKKFATVLSLAEHQKNNVKCPKCGGTKVEQQWAAFFATTSKKS